MKFILHKKNTIANCIIIKNNTYPEKINIFTKNINFKENEVFCTFTNKYNNGVQ